MLKELELGTGVPIEYETLPLPPVAVNGAEVKAVPDVMAKPSC